MMVQFEWVPLYQKKYFKFRILDTNLLSKITLNIFPNIGLNNQLTNNLSIYFRIKYSGLGFLWMLEASVTPLKLYTWRRTGDNADKVFF